MHLFSGKHEALQQRPEGNLNGNDIHAQTSAHVYTDIQALTQTHTDAQVHAFNCYAGHAFLNWFWFDAHLPSLLATDTRPFTY